MFACTIFMYIYFIMIKSRDLSFTLEHLEKQINSETFRFGKLDLKQNREEYFNFNAYIQILRLTS